MTEKGKESGCWSLKELTAQAFSSYQPLRRFPSMDRARTKGQGHGPGTSPGPVACRPWCLPQMPLGDAGW